jgi:hypothetical protein
MKDIFAFIIVFIIYIWCSPIMLLAILKCLWYWDITYWNFTQECLMNLIISVIDSI